MKANSEIPQQINVVEVEASTVRDDLSTNGTGTGSESDTLLTHRRSLDVPAGVTYFIRAGDAIKIGFAANLKDRLGGLQTSHPDELEVMAAISAADVDEFASHQKFAHLRIRGEWFRAEKELLDYIEYAKVRFGEAAPHKPAPKRKPIPPAPKKADQLIGKLQILRSTHGDDTAIGHRCSNLAQMIPIYKASTNPDQRASLAAGIKRHVGELQKLGARFH